MTPEQLAALQSLLPESRRTGDEETDLLAATREGGRRRVENPRETGTVARALHELDPERYSWRKLEVAADIPHGTLRRWAGDQPPDAAE